VVHHNRRDFHEAHAWIKAFFDTQTTDFVELEYNGYRSLIIKPKGSLRPRLLGDGHIDVVPGEAHLFGLRQTNGLVYGRGVAKNKETHVLMSNPTVAGSHAIDENLTLASLDPY